MLGVNKYPKAYIDGCRRKLADQVAAFGKLKSGSELKAFEPLFFNHMLLALDHYFMHRLRGQEGKDGNALNEVRMLASSIMENDAVLAASSTVKYDRSKAVLGLGIGDRIALDAKAFKTIADAFFAELTAKFS